VVVVFKVYSSVMYSDISIYRRRFLNLIDLIQDSRTYRIDANSELHLLCNVHRTRSSMFKRRSIICKGYLASNEMKGWWCMGKWRIRQGAFLAYFRGYCFGIHQDRL